jgi:hypothetical protein
MLTKNDIKLFNILDEYISKELTEWCIIKKDWVIREVIQVYYSLISKEIWCHLQLWIDWEAIWDIVNIPKKDLYWPKWVHDLYFNWKWDYKPFTDYWSKKIYRIVWHYPTLSTVLRYCIKNKCYIVENTDDNEKVINTSIRIGTNKGYVFDITKEIKDWSEEQKWELIKFLLSIE